MQAMILAAGFGTRLLPFSGICPKPLFPILNTPLLHITIRRLQRAGFTKIIVNCHHLREQIVESLAGFEGVYVQEETTILGTGGGLRKALKVLDDSPLLVTNGDIYHTIDFRKLYRAHTEQDYPVTMAVHHYPRFNSLEVKGDNLVGFGYKGEGSLAFTGLHVIEPEVLEGIADDQFSCIIDCYKNLLANGQSIQSHRVDGAYWTDMGTPEDYLALHEGLIHGSVPLLPGLDISLLHQDVSDLSVEDWACLDPDVSFDGPTRLTRSVVWKGVNLAGDYVDSIVVPGLEEGICNTEK